MKPALKLPPNITVFENIKKYRIGNYFYSLIEFQTTVSNQTFGFAEVRYM